MAMQGFEFMGEKPWKTLYLHGLVRDSKGQKMSKSKGNTVDPLGGPSRGWSICRIQGEIANPGAAGGTIPRPAPAKGLGKK